MSPGARESRRRASTRTLTRPRNVGCWSPTSIQENYQSGHPTLGSVPRRSRCRSCQPSSRGGRGQAFLPARVSDGRAWGKRSREIFAAWLISPTQPDSLADGRNAPSRRVPFDAARSAEERVTSSARRNRASDPRDRTWACAAINDEHLRPRVAHLSYSQTIRFASDDEACAIGSSLLAGFAAWILGSEP